MFSYELEGCMEGRVREEGLRCLPVAATAADERAEARGGDAPGPTRSNHPSIHQ